MPTVNILFVSLLEVRQSFVSEVVMAFIIYMPTLPYNILLTERRGLSSRLSRNLSILCRPTSSLEPCSTINTFSDMAYVFGRAFGNSSLFFHLFLFFKPFVSYRAVFYDCLALRLSRFKQIFCETMTQMFKTYYS